MPHMKAWSLLSSSQKHLILLMGDSPVLVWSDRKSSAQPKNYKYGTTLHEITSRISIWLLLSTRLSYLISPGDSDNIFTNPTLIDFFTLFLIKQDRYLI